MSNDGDASPSDATSFSETVPEALVGERVDRFLALVADISRSRATELIDDGRVLVDGHVPGKGSERLALGQVVEAQVPAIPIGIDPDPTVTVNIVHSDDHVIVVDKAAGVIVHPGSGVSTGTLIQGLLTSFPDLVGVGDDPIRPGVVHRLDKGTSGLLMVARTGAAHHSLTRQLAARSVTRRYLTLVWGQVVAEEGVVDAPLGRSPRDATRQAVVVDGRPARTRYKVLERFPEPDVSLVECRLETGRTHQIRVHLDAIDHPVVGDDRYGRGRPALKVLRPFLHAATLGFVHPDTNEQMSFDSDLPTDLEAVLASLR